MLTTAIIYFEQLKAFLRMNWNIACHLSRKKMVSIFGQHQSGHEQSNKICHLIDIYINKRAARSTFSYIK